MWRCTFQRLDWASIEILETFFNQTGNVFDKWNEENLITGCYLYKHAVKHILDDIDDDVFCRWQCISSGNVFAGGNVCKCISGDGQLCEEPGDNPPQLPRVRDS